MLWLRVAQYKHEAIQVEKKLLHTEHVLLFMYIYLLNINFQVIIFLWAELPMIIFWCRKFFVFMVVAIVGHTNVLAKTIVKSTTM